MIFAGALLGGLSLFAASKVMKAREGPVSTGWEELLGQEGIVRVPLDPVGQIFIEGALWRARPSEGAATPGVGDKVRVDSVEGLTLHVSPAPAQEQSVDREVSPVWP